MSQEESIEVDELISYLNYIAKGVNKNERRTEDLYSLGLLQPLLLGYPYLSFTDFAMRPFCLNHIINDISINSRESIIEFGAGISTIVIARLIKKNNLNSRIISVEHVEEWAKVINENLVKENLNDVASVFYAPLKPCDLSLDQNLWYDLDLLDKKLKGQRFDMVIIDGPPAWEASKTRARYPAVPYIIDKLKEKFSIYLDDVNRKGEQDTVERWIKQYGMQFRVTGTSLAYYYREKAFSTEPMTGMF
jgi:predicted O-methyltransferase YrrM